MTRKSFNLATLSMALFGVCMLVATPSLRAQTAPAAPAAPSISCTGTPVFPSNNPQLGPPVSFNVVCSISDATPGATIYFWAPEPTGSGVLSWSSSCTISAPSSTTTASGTCSVGSFTAAWFENQKSPSYVYAYAYIPANAKFCPPEPASANSATTTGGY